MSIIGDGIMLGAGGESASILVTGLSETDSVSATKDGKTVAGKWVSKQNPVAHGLPDEYTELKYIESTGTQYINTGKRYDDGVRVCTTVRYDSSSNLGFGAASSSGRQYLNVDNSKFQFDWGSGSSYALVSNILTYNKWHIVDVKLLNQNVNLDIDGVSVVSKSDIINTPKLDFYLFCVNVDGSPLTQSDKRYAMCETVIYDSIGDMSAYFIPCKRNSDGAIGMYDLITNTFFGNSGTGTFVAGEEIPQYIDSFEIAPIKSYGTWTVTATDGTHTKTQEVLVDVADVFSIEMRYLYYSEQELNSMGCYISRSVGDTLTQTSGRYATRSGNKPMIACAFNGAGGNGYAFISNEPITDSFTYSTYGDLKDVTGTGLVAYVKAMKYVYGGKQSYLNTTGQMLSEIYTATTASYASNWVVDSSYIELLNHIAESIPDE